MAALDRLNVSKLGVSSEVSTGIFRKAAADSIWEWYEEHKDEVIFSVGFGPIKLTKRLRDLEGLIKRITGTTNPFAR